MPERFRLEAAVFPFECERLHATHRYTVSAVRFPSPIMTPDPENNTVHAEYFRPPGGPASARRWSCCTSSGPTSRSRATWRPGWPTAAWPPCS